MTAKKRIISLMMSVLLLVSAFAGANAATVSAASAYHYVIEQRVTTEVLPAGTEFTIDLKLQPSLPDLVMTQMYVSFDQTLCEFVSAASSDFLLSFDMNQVTYNPYGSHPDQIWVTGVREQGISSTGFEVLATITFRVRTGKAIDAAHPFVIKGVGVPLLTGWDSKEKDNIYYPMDFDGDGGMKYSSAKYKIGDVNRDNSVDMKDSRLVFQATSGKTTLDNEQKILADINEDGVVDMKDTRALFRQVSGA